MNRLALGLAIGVEVLGGLESSSFAEDQKPVHRFTCIDPDVNACDDKDIACWPDQDPKLNAFRKICVDLGEATQRKFPAMKVACNQGDVLDIDIQCPAGWTVATDHLLQPGESEKDVYPMRVKRAKIKPGLPKEGRTRILVEVPVQTSAEYIERIQRAARGEFKETPDEARAFSIIVPLRCQRLGKDGEELEKRLINLVLGAHPLPAPVAKVPNDGHPEPGKNPEQHPKNLPKKPRYSPGFELTGEAMGALHFGKPISFSGLGSLQAALAFPIPHHPRHELLPFLRAGAGGGQENINVQDDMGEDAGTDKAVTATIVLGTGLEWAIKTNDLGGGGSVAVVPGVAQELEIRPGMDAQTDNHGRVNGLRTEVKPLLGLSFAVRIKNRLQQFIGFGPALSIDETTGVPIVGFGVSGGRAWMPKEEGEHEKK